MRNSAASDRQAQRAGSRPPASRTRESGGVPPPRRTISRIGLALSLALTWIAAAAHAGDVSIRLDSGSGFSVKNAAGAIERLRVDEATGNVSRNGALFVHTTGTNSLFVGPGAGNLTTTGWWNSGFGGGALQAVTNGGFNTAVGRNALYLNTSGYSNSALGVEALRNNTTANGNSAFGTQTLRDNTTGFQNSAMGAGALRSNTTGSQSAAFGYEALRSNLIGFSNSAFGSFAMRNNTGGVRNAAFGHFTLPNNSTGANNSAFGQFALYANTTGADNTAIGRYALKSNNAGSRNIAIGSGAGESLTTGSDNIYIGSNALAVESGQIRIGSVGTHTKTRIAGIVGNTLAVGYPVVVASDGELGSTTSSARFKQDVRDMADASDVLMQLRPVTFRYREEVVGAEGATVTQYGLIAEEVAEVAPDLVLADAEGRPNSVKYHELPALLLNEVKQQHRINEEQKQRIAELTARLEALEASPDAAREAGAR